ncbi:MAG: uL15 family ribosomal protein [Candidatus Thermoplasmatota archaeon]|nr:uL15 family ribosomal protein [Candidatus Thermoplasmatota archaeon]
MSTKNEKMRGKKTHGHGIKARRGAGKRGGRGMAGNHKHRYMHIIKYYGKEYFGRHGFKRPQSVVSADITINLSTIRENIDSMTRDGVAKKKGEGYDIDLEKFGITKLLGGGSIGELNVHVLTRSASQRAVEKIEASGGSVTISEK